MFGSFIQVEKRCFELICVCFEYKVEPYLCLCLLCINYVIGLLTFIVFEVCFLAAKLGPRCMR
jgi:hypothetical protein